jgi:hypothetical protein
MSHGRVCNENSAHTYKVFKYEPGKPGEITVTRNVRWGHWDHPYKSKSKYSPLSTKVDRLNEKSTIRKSYC